MSKYNNKTSNAVYGMGFIGAAIYYISSSSSFFGGLIGLLKAIVWPAFLVYDALKALNPEPEMLQEVLLLLPGIIT
jgi:hypothetical protein